jgi:hypothetical protein
MADIDNEVLFDILRRLAELEDTVTSLTLDPSEDEDLDEEFDLDDEEDDEDDSEEESEDQE